MYADFHTHSILSDGVLIASELVRRYEEAGYDVIGITDHADTSNLKSVAGNIAEFAHEYNQKSKIKVIPGVELTHVPPYLMKKLVKKSREMGAQIVIVHGETSVEPVLKGTNRAAINAEVDILAHPGFISEADAKLAKKNGVLLEISARKGHSLTNGYVTKIAKKTGAGLIYGTDFHEPGDLVCPKNIVNILKGAGLDSKQIEKMKKDTSNFIKKIF